MGAPRFKLQGDPDRPHFLHSPRRAVEDLLLHIANCSQFMLHRSHWLSVSLLRYFTQNLRKSSYPCDSPFVSRRLTSIRLTISSAFCMFVSREPRAVSLFRLGRTSRASPRIRHCFCLRNSCIPGAYSTAHFKFEFISEIDTFSLGLRLSAT